MEGREKMKQAWQRFQEFREFERLVREDPDRARLFDREGNFDSPVPWWQDNHRGLAKRRKLALVRQEVKL
jgi:hypothetical protein